MWIVIPMMQSASQNMNICSYSLTELSRQDFKSESNNNEIKDVNIFAQRWDIY